MRDRMVCQLLPATERSTRAARTFASDVLTRWSLVTAVDEIVLCVSELVTNAVAHGSPRIPGEVVLLLTHRPDDGVLRVEVRDQSPHLPTPCTPQSDEEAGRGLLLVDQIAVQWGATPGARGKTVWAEIPTTLAVPAPLVPPTPHEPMAEVLSLVTSTQWVQDTVHGRVAFLLLTHPPGDAEADLVERRMRALGAELRLAALKSTLPDLGQRLSLQDEYMYLRLNSGLGLRLPIAYPQWGQFVREEGGVVVVAVALDARTPTTDRAALDAMLGELTLADRLLLGKTVPYGARALVGADA